MILMVFLLKIRDNSQLISAISSQKSIVVKVINQHEWVQRNFYTNDLEKNG